MASSFSRDPWAMIMSKGLVGPDKKLSQNMRSNYTLKYDDETNFTDNLIPTS